MHLRGAKSESWAEKWDFISVYRISNSTFGFVYSTDVFGSLHSFFSFRLSTAQFFAVFFFLVSFCFISSFFYVRFKIYTKINTMLWFCKPFFGSLLVSFWFALYGSVSLHFSQVILFSSNSTVQIDSLITFFASIQRILNSKAISCFVDFVVKSKFLFLYAMANRWLKIVFFVVVVELNRVYIELQAFFMPNRQENRTQKGTSNDFRWNESQIFVKTNKKIWQIKKLTQIKQKREKYM